MLSKTKSNAHTWQCREFHLITTGSARKVINLSCSVQSSIHFYDKCKRCFCLFQEIMNSPMRVYAHFISNLGIGEFCYKIGDKSKNWPFCLYRKSSTKPSSEIYSLK